MALQRDWASCPKCQGLHYAGFPNKGVCPAGGQHEQVGSFAYEVEFDVPEGPNLQRGWASCPKCQGLHFAGHADFKGICPAGGGHEQTGSFAYAVSHGFGPDSAFQPDWKACPKCQGLFYGPYGGRCPGGGAHSADASWDYQVRGAAIHRFTFDPGISLDDRMMLIDRHRTCFLAIEACTNIDAEAKNKLFGMYRGEVKHGFNTDANARASAKVGGDTIQVNFTAFASGSDDENSQTLIHELAHLAGYDHPDKKDSDTPGDGGDYYGSVPLQAEFCIAGVQSDLICETGDDLRTQIMRPFSPGDFD